MASPSHEEIVRNGGGKTYYVWHVSGYPWAVTNNPAVINALNYGTGAALSARRKIFGTETISASYLADDEDNFPVFSVLESAGKQSMEVQEIQGALNGGDYTIKISDQELGHSWAKWGSSVAPWGLPGVHSIAQEQLDSNVGWGYLNTNLDKGYGSLEVVPQDNGTLQAGITGDYRLLWIGQECMAATGVSLSSGVLTIIVSARGVARSRDQHHWTEYFSGVNPVVKDHPDSIIDKPCWLWSVTLTDDNEILTQPVLERPAGKVLNCETHKGITTIRIGSPFQQLDNELSMSRFNGHLARYVFSRSDGGTKPSHVVTNRESPHLVIREFSSDTDNVGTVRCLWLCDQNSTVVFNTAQDVIDAIMTEIGYCMEGDSSQESGDSATPGDDNEHVTLTYHYQYYEGKIIMKETDGSAPDKMSYLNGPCAWLFNLGNLLYANEKTAIERCNRANAHFWYSEFTCDEGSGFGSENRPWMTTVPFPAHSVATYVESGHWNHSSPLWHAQYLYQWSWSTADIGWSGAYPPNSNDFSLAGGALYLPPENDTDEVAVNDDILLGIPGDVNPGYGPSRFAQATVSAVTTDGGFPELTVGSTVTFVTGNPPPFFIGAGIAMVPAWEVAGQDGEENIGLEHTSEGFDIDWATWEITLGDRDPWRLSQAFSISTSDLGGIFKALLGGSVSGISLPDNFHLDHVAGFLTTGDFTSIIDWDELTNVTKPVRELLGLNYHLSLMEPLSFLDLLKNELLIHGVSPTWEWDSSSGQFMMRFRPIGPPNITEANNGGRILTDSTIVYGEVPKVIHNTQRLANHAEIKLNWANEEFGVNIGVNIRSGHAVNQSTDKKLKIESKMTHISAVDILPEYFGNLLQFFGSPKPSQTIKVTYASKLDLAVGREMMLTDSTGRLPYDHSLGLTNQPAMVTKMVTNLDSNIITATYRLSNRWVYGIAPACYVAADNSTKGASKRITCTSELHEFTPSDGAVDCMFFGCYTWNKSSDVYTAKSCSCGEYKVIAFERDTDSITPMEFNVYDVESDGTIVLEDQDGSSTNYNAWDTTKPNVIIFAKWDDVESCQKNYIYLADSNGVLGAGNDPGMRWE